MNNPVLIIGGHTLFRNDVFDFNKSANIQAKLIDVDQHDDTMTFEVIPQTFRMGRSGFSNKFLVHGTIRKTEHVPRHAVAHGGFMKKKNKKKNKSKKKKQK